MKERPILFKGEKVRAILDGRKTKTRRVVNPQPPEECSIHFMLGAESQLPPNNQTPLRHHWEAWWGYLYKNRPQGHLCGTHTVKCPYGKQGDRLWVRETFRIMNVDKSPGPVVYKADHPEDKTVPETYGRAWKPPIHMPRWASRITLEITDVRVERLQDISEKDAEFEGG